MKTYEQWYSDGARYWYVEWFNSAIESLKAAQASVKKTFNNSPWTDLN